MSKIRAPYEEFESDDETSHLKKLFTNKERSYDIIAKHCGVSASTLESHAKIRRLKPGCRIYQHIVDYGKRSCGGVNLNILRIYKIQRKNESKPFTDKYRMLLWHGTKPQFVPGIIQTGFRPGSGGLYGGGIYLADRFAKSAGYVGKTAGNIAYLFIAEVNLGKVYKAHHTHSNYSSAPPGFDTVKGYGSQIPTWRQNKTYGGAILPCGETRLNPRFTQYDLSFSEYIVYDPNRVIIRFLVECTF